MTDDEKIERCKQALAEIADHRGAIAALGAERSRLIRELQQSGYGLGRQAKIFGISKSRVQQLAGPSDGSAAAADIGGR